MRTNKILTAIAVFCDRSRADTNGDGTVSYREFVPIARQLLVKVLAEQNRAAGDGGQQGEWLEMYSPGEGTWYLNKNTGKTTFNVPDNVRPRKLTVLRSAANPEATPLIPLTQLTHLSSRHLSPIGMCLQIQPPSAEELVREALTTHFRAHDPEGSGYVPVETFWQEARSNPLYPLLVAPAVARATSPRRGRLVGRNRRTRSRRGVFSFDVLRAGAR